MRSTCGEFSNVSNRCFSKVCSISPEEAAIPSPAVAPPPSPWDVQRKDIADNCLGLFVHAEGIAGNLSRLQRCVARQQVVSRYCISSFDELR